MIRVSGSKEDILKASKELKDIGINVKSMSEYHGAAKKCVAIDSDKKSKLIDICDKYNIILTGVRNDS